MLDLIDREPEFEGEKLVIYILNRSRFWEESGLLNMLESAGYEEGKCFHVIEDIEELKSIVKEILEKKYEGKKRKKKFGENNFFDKNWQSLYILEMRFLKYQGTSK